MMNLYRLKNSLLFFLTTVVLIMGMLLMKCANMTVMDAFPNEGGCVPNQETAIKIAQAVVAEETGNSYSRELFKAVSVNGDTEDEEYCYVSYDVMLAQENSFSFVTSIGNLENIFYRNVFNAKNNYVMLNMCAHPDRYTCMDLEANTSNAYVK